MKCRVCHFALTAPRALDTVSYAVEALERAITDRQGDYFEVALEFRDAALGLVGPALGMHSFCVAVPVAQLAGILLLSRGVAHG